MDFGYFHEEESEQFAFYRIPQVLFKDEKFAKLSTDAKVLYGLFLNRVSLSKKNHWIDDEGRVYVYYTLVSIQEDLHCASQKALKLLKELESYGLIERVKQEMPELKESLNTIREAAADLITKIDAKVQELTAEKEPISFYVAECGEFHSMGGFHENLTLQQAVDIYKSIPSDRMNGVKTIGFVIKDDQLLANEYDLVVGNRLNMQEMKDILPELAAHPQVVKAADEIAKLLPELNGADKGAVKDVEKEDSVSKKIKEKSKAARPKKAKTSKKKEEVAI